MDAPGMSGTKRTRIARPAIRQFSPRALALFEQLERARRQRRAATCIVGNNPSGYCNAECPACRTWYDLHNQLHIELGLMSWEWLCLPRNPYPPGTSVSRNWRPGEQQALWQLLDEARRRRSPQPVTV